VVREGWIGKDPPPPIIVVSNERRSNIVVDDTADHFVIFRRNEEDQPIVKVPKDKFRLVLFQSCSGANICIRTKICKVSFHGCADCNVTLKSPMLGPAEFYQCRNLYIYVKVQAIVTIENCSRLNVVQVNDEVIYVLKICIDVRAQIVSPETRRVERVFQLGKLIWGEAERQFMSLSRKDGLISVQENYILNDIATHLLFLPPEEEIPDVIVGTPP